MQPNNNVWLCLNLKPEKVLWCIAIFKFFNIHDVPIKVKFFWDLMLAQEGSLDMNLVPIRNSANIERVKKLDKISETYPKETMIAWILWVIIALRSHLWCPIWAFGAPRPFPIDLLPLIPYLKKSNVVNFLYVNNAEAEASSNLFVSFCLFLFESSSGLSCTS